MREAFKVEGVLLSFVPSGYRAYCRPFLVLMTRGATAGNDRAITYRC